MNRLAALALAATLVVGVPAHAFGPAPSDIVPNITLPKPPQPTTTRDAVPLDIRK